jgi:uncharacterized protein (DUF58 family)
MAVPARSRGAAAGGGGSPTPRLTATGRALLGLAASAYAGGVALGYPELLILAVGCLLLLAFAAAMVVAPPRLDVARQFDPARVTVGDAVLGRAMVRNRSRWPTPACVVVDRLGRLPIEIRVPLLGGRGSRTIHYAIPTVRRGRYQLGPVTVERRDPLGLLSRMQPHGQSGVLWVHPRRHRAVPLPVGILLDYEGVTTPAAPKGAVAFSSLREYVPGDDPRQIHWKSTARTGTLMVREHVDTSQPTTTVLLERCQAAWTGEAFEHAVEVAASIVTAVARGGWPVRLGIAGEDAEAAELTGAAGTLDRLAAVEPSSRVDRGELLLLAEQAAPNGVLVVVTGNAAAGVTTRLARQRRAGLLVLIQLVPGAPPSTARHADMVVVRAPGAAAAVGAWNRLARGGRA